jgi:hypothetical protein
MSQGAYPNSSFFHVHLGLTFESIKELEGALIMPILVLAVIKIKI